MSRRGGGKTQLSKQKKLFALLKKELGKGNLEGSRSILKELEVSCMDYNDTLLSIIGGGKKAPVPPEERFIEYIEGNSHTKLTVNPRTGRMTLKVARSIKSNTVRGNLSDFVELLRLKDDLPPITLRGKVDYYNGTYYWLGLSESKITKYSFKMEV
jgi:hypothetical protein